MTNTMVKVQQHGKRDRGLEDMLISHPYAAFFAAFFGMPLVILTSVGALSAAIVFPISWILRWL